MRTILHLTETSEPGGSETVLAYIAANLDPKRYRSRICLLREGWLTSHLRELRLEYQIIENRHSYDPGFLMRLLRLIRREKIDLIHSHEFMMNVYGAIAARLCGIPMIGTVHGKVYFTEKKLRILAYKLAFGICSGMIAVSEDLKKYLIDSLNPGKPGKILTIYNGIDLTRFAMGGYPNDIARKLSIEPGTVIAGSVGSLFEVKGFEYLLRAAKKVRDALPDFRLLIVGEGRQEEPLKRLAETLGLRDTVDFMGFRKDVPGLLNLLDIYVCSSISEGLSLSILEAMASGKPIVATSVGGNPELVAEGQNGFLVAPRDAGALSERIIDLARDEKLRLSMGKRSRQIAEEKFSLKAMIENYQQLYQRLIG
jgi:glycosyltransferase involved in cell wall biosynthesis